LKILIAEDDRTNVLVLRRTLETAGYSDITVEVDGQKALERMRGESFDLLLTDWMMPQLDGIGLIHAVREEISPTPPIIMITALASPESRSQALASGADDFVAKPIQPQRVIAQIERLMDKFQQDSGAPSSLAETRTARTGATAGGDAVVCIAASTGGPAVMREVVRGLRPSGNACFYFVQHAPDWMFLSLKEMLQGETELDVQMVNERVRPRAGRLYMPGGERHLVIESPSGHVDVQDGPMVNFVKPAADPLFESAAIAFGSRCIAVVLTGMGKDGTEGARAISESGGVVIVQSPDTSVAPSMPQHVIDAGLADHILAPEEIASAVMSRIAEIEGRSAVMQS